MRKGSMLATAIVLLMVGASFGALFGNVTAYRSAADGFGYVYTDSKAPAPSVAFTWTDISATGTDTFCSGDDDWAGPFPIGFDFQFYGNRYSMFNVTTNGYIMFGGYSTDYGNDPMPSSNTPSNIIAAYWDDLYADSGEITYQTIGAAPYRQLVVEFYTVTRLGNSNQMTFEIMLNETMGDIWVNYLTMSTMTGNSASEGIENSDGTIGLQYGYNTAVLQDSLSIRYALPDIMIGPSQTLAGQPGDVMSYDLVVTNKQTVTDSIAITYTSLVGWSIGVFDEFMTPLTDTDGDTLPDTGNLASMESKNIVVEVTIPTSPADAEDVTTVNASSYADPLLYFNCTLTTQVLPGWLEPPHNDYGDDTDSDGAFDYLVVEVSIGVFTAGWYTVEGTLHTSSENYLSYDWAQQYFTAGYYDLVLQFYGWHINEAAMDGPYHVHLTLWSPSWTVIGTGTHTTSPYSYSEFMEIPGEFSIPFSDAGVDLDSDGLYDQLQVDVMVDVNYAGRFIITTYLYDPSWNWLVTATSDTTLTVGLNTVTFYYDAWDISDAMTGGQFRVACDLQAEVDGALPYVDSHTHVTNTYDLLEFERPGAVFISPYSDWGVDLDGDLLYDYLIVEIGVNVTVEDDYLIAAELQDWWGDPFLTATNLTHLAVGDHLVQLAFAGWPIRYNGDSGPWDIYLTIKDGSVLCDEWWDNTGSYSWNDFEDAPGWFETPHSDMAVDDDGDLLYDYLVVTVGVNVSVAGTYRISATLYDDWWNTVETVNNVTILPVNSSLVELRFTGWLINTNGNDGVYYVDLYLYDSGDRQLDFDSYTTASYLYADFEGVLAAFGSPLEWFAANDDADADYERLVVNVTVEMYYAGTVLIYGVLYDSGWDWIASSSVLVSLAAGTQVVQLSFPGWMISELGTTGIYHVELELYDENRYYLDWASLSTTSLTPADFDTTVMSITSEWAPSVPSVDGMVLAGEWDSAEVIDLTLVVPINGVEGEVRIMNDAGSLYILIDAYGDLTLDTNDYASMAFDTDNDGVGTDDHEDQFYLSGTGQTHYVYDTAWWAWHCSPFDHDGLYGEAGFGPSPTDARDHRIYEFSIPLSLLGAVQGDTLGFVLRSDSYWGLYDGSMGTHSDWPMSFPSFPELSVFPDLILASSLPDPPPVTTATVAGTAGSAGWYKSSTTVTLTATGGDGGVDYTEYRIEGGSWVTYTAPLGISGEGTHTVEFRSVDMAGQIESTKTLVIKIDSVAPVSSDTVSGATVSLDATDATSGIGSIMYRVDGGSWTTYTGVIEFTEPGTYLIDFYSVDVAGNVEISQTITVEVDEDGIPAMVIAAIVAIGVAIPLLLLFLLKRRKRQQPADMMTMSQPPMMPPPPPQA